MPEHDDRPARDQHDPHADGRRRPGRASRATRARRSALAPAAYVLYTRVMKHNPADPKWPDRDRFVLSAGHASMLLYASLHLSGYDDERSTRSSSSASSARTRRAIRRTSRRRASRRRPARSARASATRVGMAMAERFLREKFGAEVCDHHIFAICSDGDLMEGVASEAASLAGHLALGRCVFLYDDNEITIDGPTEPRVLARGRRGALRGLRLAHAHGRGRQRPRGDRGRDPRRHGRGGAADADPPQDGDRLRLAARRHAERALRPDAATRGAGDEGGARLGSRRAVPRSRRGLRALPTRASSAAPRRRPSGRRGSTPGRPRTPSSPPSGTTPGPASRAPASPRRCRSSSPRTGRSRRASRAAQVMQAFGPFVPTMVGGAADLVHSTFTEFEGEPDFSAEHAGRNVALGRPRARDGRGGQRPRAARRDRQAVLLDVLRLHRLHAPADPALGADEARLRLDLQPRLGRGRRGRPDAPAGRAPRGDARDPEPDRDPPGRRERGGRGVGRDPRRAHGARSASCSRARTCRSLDRTRARAGVAACAAARTCSPTSTRPTSCSSRPGAEVATALGARDLLAEKGVQVRVVSMPSWELFEAQDADYRDEVLPRGRAEDLGRGRRRRSAGRAGSTPRSGSTASARRARATRCSSTSASAPRPSRARVEADDRRARRLVVKVRVGFTPAEQVAAPVGHRDRRAARDVDDLPGARRRATSASSASARSRTRARSPATASRSRGERRNVLIDGFDFGNSPREFLEPPSHSTLVMTTTNGTRLLLAAAARCETVLVGVAAEPRRGRRGGAGERRRRRRGPVRRRRGRVRDRRRLRRRPHRRGARRRARRRGGRGDPARGLVRHRRGGHRRRHQRRRTSATRASTRTSRGARARACSTSCRASSSAATAPVEIAA